MEVGAEWDGDAFTAAKSTAAQTPMGRWVTAWRSEAGAKRFSGVIGENYGCLFRTGVSIADVLKDGS